MNSTEKEKALNEIFNNDPYNLLGKFYKVKFLTEKGIIEKIICDKDDIKLMETELKKEYGNFTQLSATEIFPQYRND